MRKSTTPSRRAIPFIKMRTVPKMGNLSGVPLVKSHMVYWMHRYENQAVPCTHPNCLFDLAEIPQDQRIYLPVYNHDAREEWMLDLPTSLHGVLCDAKDRYGDLRRVVVKFQRREARKNAAIKTAVAELTTATPRLDFEYEVDDAITQITAKTTSWATGQILAKNPELRGSIVTAHRMTT